MPPSALPILKDEIIATNHAVNEIRYFMFNNLAGPPVTTLNYRTDELGGIISLGAVSGFVCIIGINLPAR
jgi:hypothetical protein